MGTVTLNVADLELCDRTRVRAQRPKDGSDIVLDYSDAYRNGLIVEPLDVFRERGTERYIVADGEHRLLALRAAKIATVECRLHEGDEVAALDFAIGCNHAHGVRRTKADKYRAFVRIMETPTLRKKYATDSDLCEKVGVSKRTIADYKAEWRESEGGDARTREKKTAAKSTATKHDRTKTEPPKRELTAEQKKVAAQVRESVAPKADKSPRPAAKQWTAEDDHAMALLRSAWNKATMAAREKFRGEIA